MQNPGSSSKATLLPGTRLGRYEITSFVAAGGMGEVYRAKDPSLDRDIAIKVLPADVAADAGRRARFEREAQMAAGLNHPGIVTIHSVEHDGGRVFITMELVKGKPLAELIPHDGLPNDKLLAIAVPLANAVSAAHDNGITHRDLKPANVVVGDDGAVKVLDFGIAKRHDVDASTDLAATASLATAEGRLIGTIAYMSPEQAEGKRADTILFLHLLATVAKLAGPGGARAVVAESVLVKHQLLILNRSRQRSPNLRPADRVVAGLCALLMRPGRSLRSAIVFKPSTLLRLHRALIQRKYHRLFSSKGPMKRGLKGPSPEVIAAVVDMKQRNPSWGCPRIAQQITLAFGIPMNKDVVRRILAVRYQPTPDSAGPSWLTVLGHAKDSLWSLDLFRCESAILHTHWVLVVMDQCTRRIVGFGVHRGVVDGAALCHMFNRAIGRQPSADLPQLGP